MMSETGKPFSAYSMAGARMRDIGSLPYLPWSLYHPATAPGTDTACIPLDGMSRICLLLKKSSVAFEPAHPLPLRPAVLLHINEREHIPANTGHHWLHNVQNCGGGDRGVHSISAILQYAQGCR